MAEDKSFAGDKSSGSGFGTTGGEQTVGQFSATDTTQAETTRTGAAVVGALIGAATMTVVNSIGLPPSATLDYIHENLDHFSGTPTVLSDIVKAVRDVPFGQWNSALLLGPQNVRGTGVAAIVGGLVGLLTLAEGKLRTPPAGTGDKVVQAVN